MTNSTSLKVNEMIVQSWHEFKSTQASIMSAMTRVGLTSSPRDEWISIILCPALPGWNKLILKRRTVPFVGCGTIERLDPKNLSDIHTKRKTTHKKTSTTTTLSQDPKYHRKRRAEGVGPAPTH